jgi:hypothetical protein
MGVWILREIPELDLFFRQDFIREASHFISSKKWTLSYFPL